MRQLGGERQPWITWKDSNPFFENSTLEPAFRRLPLQSGFRLHGAAALHALRHQQRGRPLPRQQLPEQHPRDRARGHRHLRRPDAHLARTGVGLRHLGRHRGQHVRPLPGAGALSRRRGLFLPGYPLQRGQDHERAEGAQHHDKEPGQRGDRLRRPPRDHPHQPGRARNRDGEHRHDDEGRGRRREQDPRHPGRPRGDQVLPARGRCAQRHDPAVRGRPAALRVRRRASTALPSAGTRWWARRSPAASR